MKLSPLMSVPVIAVVIAFSASALIAQDKPKPGAPATQPASRPASSPRPEHAAEQREAKRSVTAGNVNQLKDAEYAKVGGKSLTLDLFRPARKTGGKLPVVVWIHGGAWWAGNKDGCPATPLVIEGYAVVSINYRLSGEAIFPAQVHDCKAAIRWLRANADKYELDPDRIGVWGASAGGHLVALLGVSGSMKELEGDVGGNTDQSSAVQCVVDFFGPADFTSRRDIPSRPDRRPLTQLMGGTLMQKQRLYLLGSPAQHVARDNPPFLIMHGDADAVVPVEHSKVLHDSIQKVGGESELVILKGGSHGGGEFFTEENRRKILDFFNKHLKAPKPAQAPAKPPASVTPAAAETATR